MRFLTTSGSRSSSSPVAGRGMDIIHARYGTNSANSGESSRNAASSFAGRVSRRRPPGGCSRTVRAGQSTGANATGLSISVQMHSSLLPRLPAAVSARNSTSLDFPMPAWPDTTTNGAPVVLACSHRFSSWSRSASRPDHLVRPDPRDLVPVERCGRSVHLVRGDGWRAVSQSSCRSPSGDFTNSKNPSTIRRVALLTHTVSGLAAVSMRFAMFAASPKSPPPISAIAARHVAAASCAP